MHADSFLSIHSIWIQHADTPDFGNLDADASTGNMTLAKWYSDVYPTLRPKTLHEWHEMTKKLNQFLRWYERKRNNE